MTDYKGIVDKSNVPVGTSDEVRNAITQSVAKHWVSTPSSVVSNPEFLKEGAVAEDFVRPGRIAFGCDDEQGVQYMRALYTLLQRNHDRLIVMDCKSYEFTQYDVNSMLATRMSFMNELANLADILGVDIKQFRKAIANDTRIGFDFLYCGCGGSCFPKDIKGLIKTASDHADLELKVLIPVAVVNDVQKHVLTGKIKKRFGTNLKGMHFALWSLAFKANADDMRDAASPEVIADLLGMCATVTAYDPVTHNEAQKIYTKEPRLTYAENSMMVPYGVEAWVNVTEWKKFESSDFDTTKFKLKSAVKFDDRNLYDPALVRGQGLEYLVIGR